MIVAKAHNRVLVIALSNPPVNALGPGLRKSLADAILDAQADDKIDAIVVSGSGGIFSGGADITEFGGPFARPSLPEVVEVVEACGKPIVAAIDGVALGGGLELALACHYRFASKSARMGLPEVKLGLLPGAGGTQRLPRLVGMAAALDMIVLGEPVSADRALTIGLIDDVVEADALLEDAITFAETVAAPRRASEKRVEPETGQVERFAAANARKIKGLDAPRACMEAIQAAQRLPFAEGSRLEVSLFARLVEGEQSQAMRHAFFAERAAARIDGMPDGIVPRSVSRVGVIGAGTMGGGISMNFLSAGIPVTIVEMTQDALDRGLRVVRANYEASAAKGRLTAAQVDGAMTLLAPTLDFDALADCDLVIEAVYETMDVKKEIFARLDTIARPGGILASNTSFLDIDEIASATTRPDDVVGMHFFSPANVMRLLEVVRGAKTAPDTLVTAMALGRRVGKVPVVAGVCHGFIGNRMLVPRQREATKLLLEGATPAQIDKVHTDFGMPMGPFQMLDLAGVDIGWHRDPVRIESISDALCARRRWGQKTKAGYYDYDEARRPSASLETQEIIDDFRRKARIAPRAISDEEIVVRTLYTMVNEGALILEDGIAQRASDIDVVWLHGYGWPRHLGGPMFWADQIGLQSILDGLARYAGPLGHDLVVSTLLQERAAVGAKLDR